MRLTDVGRTGPAQTLATLRAGSAGATPVLAFSAGRPLFAIAAGGTARLLDLTDPHRPRTAAAFATRARDVQSVALSPDGKLLAAGGADGSLRVWNVAGRHPSVVALTEVPGASPVRSVAFGPDGRALATACEDGSVRLWDFTDSRSPAVVKTFTLNAYGGQHTAATSVSFSRQRHLLGAVGGEDTVRVWDISDPRRPRVRLESGGVGVPNLASAFSPDGAMFAVGSRTGQVSYFSMVAEPEASPATRSETCCWTGRARSPRWPSEPTDPLW